VADTETSLPAGTPPSGALGGCHVLVVEDDFLIGDALADLLADAGAIVLGPVGRLSEARALLQREDARFEMAVLDIDLHGESSYAIADLLLARGVPFLFTTGYSHDAVDADYRDHPRLQKPLSGRILVAALARMRPESDERPAG
jgi:DNA-binding response OmpR family regulator